MDSVVGIVLGYTENYIMPKKQFLLRGGISQDLESQRPKIKENNISVAFPADELDFSDIPELGQPLPEVSVREQQRLTSISRGKLLSCQRGHQQRFLDMWQAQAEAQTQAEKCNHEV